MVATNKGRIVVECNDIAQRCEPESIQSLYQPQQYNEHVCDEEGSWLVACIVRGSCYTIHGPCI